ncbi:helix-turn-helix transcriptional regulator [Thomasclavelia sp.]|uniref:helix-turn-helix domain-containing protein n=1 Tax=Thomasclavelia sp. TaxID=3025757 RepID=UPI0025F0A80A|nr:helix-turn-helix transcriptional regulator [Thomasclavelia sp.]
MNKTHNDINIKFGEKLKKLRKDRGMTQTELAKKLGTTQSTIYKYENGLRTVHITALETIAEVFQTSIDFFLEKNNKLERIIIANDPHLRRSYEKWAKEVNESYFSDEELDKLIDYAKYLISQRKKD